MRAAKYVFLFYMSFATTLLADETQWRALDEAALAAANSGRLEEARKIAEEALTLARQEFGNDDVRTAGSLALVAEVLMAMEKWPEAEIKLREASAIREQKLEPGHPDLEQSLNLIGRVLTAQGRFEEAEPLHLKALAAAEKAAKAGEVGPRAPRWKDMVLNLDLLATFYQASGNDAKASEMRWRAVEALDRYARNDREDHLLGLEALAESAMSHGAFDDAERIAGEQLRLAETYFGTAKLAASLHLFATMFESYSEYARAEPLYQRLLATQEKALGASHVDLAATLHGLAVLYRRQEEFGKAVPLLERALSIRRKALGAFHPEVATTLRELGSIYESQNDYAKATPLFEEALAISEKVLEPDDPLLATAALDLGFAYFIEDDLAKAEPLYKRALAIREKALGPDHVDVGWSLRYLAWLYAGQEQYEKAEPLYRRALAIMEKNYGPENATVVEMAERLGQLYRKMGRPAEAEKFEKRAAASDSNEN